MPGPNGVESHHKFSHCDNLLWLVFTLIKHKFALKLAQVFHHLTTQHKLMQVSLSIVFTRISAHKAAFKWIFWNFCPSTVTCSCVYKLVRLYPMYARIGIWCSWFKWPFLLFSFQTKWLEFKSLYHPHPMPTGLFSCAFQGKPLPLRETSIATGFLCIG